MYHVHFCVLLTASTGIETKAKIETTKQNQQTYTNSIFGWWWLPLISFYHAAHDFILLALSLHRTASTLVSR